MKYLTSAFQLVGHIEQARQHSDSMPELRAMMAASVYTKQFRTFVYRGPRRYGHTTVIKTLLTAYPKSAVIAPNERCELMLYTDNIATPDTLVSRLTGLDTTPYVFVDDASFITFDDTERIYKQFAGRPDLFFVFLG